MDRTLKHWELALLFGILVAMISAFWLGHERTELAQSVIRFHVIANSDTTEDQSLKLAVRDEVLMQVGCFYPENASLEQAQQAIQENLNTLAATARAVVETQGYDYPVSAQLTECWFPTKEYDDFALPAGEYTALRIVIGEGAGQNWWCVAFPPLCLGAATETVDEAVQAGRFSPTQQRLITEENEGYVIKFKSLELLGNLQGFLQKK